MTLYLLYKEIKGVKVCRLASREYAPKGKEKRIEDVINEDYDRVILDLGEKDICPDGYGAINVLITLIHQTHKHPEPLRVISANPYIRLLLKDTSRYFRFYNTQQEAIDSFYHR